MVHGRNNVSLLVLGTPNQEFVVIMMVSGSDVVYKLAETSSTRGLANIKERRFPDFAANSDFECYQAQAILGRERGDNEVEGSLYDTMLEIRNADSNLGRGDGDDEDEVQRRVTKGGEGI